MSASQLATRLRRVASQHAQPLKGLRLSARFGLAASLSASQKVHIKAEMLTSEGLFKGPKRAESGSRRLERAESAPLGAKHLPASNLDRYLGEGSLSWPVDHLAPGDRVEDRAVAGTGEFVVLVGHRAALVRADRRVGDEVPALEVNEHGRTPRVLELHGIPCRYLGGLCDGLTP